MQSSRSSTRRTSAPKPCMQWSQLKKQTKKFICQELQGRVDFHRAVYRQHGSRLPARCWITVDGEEVFNCADLDTDWRMAYLEAKSRLEREQPEADQWVLSDEAWREADSDFPRGGFLGSALHEYIAAPIANSLKSATQIVQAFAIVDRRVGRRTLERFCASPDLPPLTRLFVKLRLTSNATAHGATSAEQGIASKERSRVD